MVCSGNTLVFTVYWAVKKRLALSKKEIKCLVVLENGTDNLTWSSRNRSIQLLLFRVFICRLSSPYITSNGPRMYKQDTQGGDK